MVLQIYANELFPSSRAVLIFARANNIDFEKKIIWQVDKSPEYLAINPMGDLPAIVDDGFKLFESHAILRYLAKSRSTPDHWYPADPTKSAVVDCMLDWHHTYLRAGSKVVFEYGFTKKAGLPFDESIAKKSLVTFIASMKLMEDNWLTGEGPFLGGATEPSIADLSLSCEIQQMQLLERAEYQEVMASRKKILNWVQATEDSISPQYGEVHNSIDERLDEYHQHFNPAMEHIY